jgi:uroporphyrinogen decarboxylase
MIGNNKLSRVTGKSDKRRFLAALHHEKSDRVPNFEIVLDNRIVSHILNRPGSGPIGKLPPEDALEVIRRVGQDATSCPLSYYPDVYGIIHGRGDEKKLAFPDPDERYNKLRKYCDCFAGTETALIAQLTGVLAPAYMSFGPIPIQDFMCLLYDDGKFACYLMDLFKNYTLRIIETIKDLNFDAYYIGDDVGSNDGPLISPSMLKDLWAPRMKEIIDAANAQGRPVIVHCCGDQSPILPYMREWNVSAVHPLQPPINDIYEVAREYGSSLTLVGNIDLATVLSFGTPDEVYQDTRRHIETLGRNGGYVVCSSHSIIDSVPPENYFAMIKAAHDGY